MPWIEVRADNTADCGFGVIRPVRNPQFVCAGKRSRKDAAVADKSAMLRYGIFHLLFFVVFFSIGAVALGVAVLCDDFVQYCRNRHLVKEAEISVHRLKSLNADYDGLLEQLESNPDLLKRIAPITLGTGPTDPCAIYPKARAEELAVARKALVEHAGEEQTDASIPKWLQRCSEPPKRIALFIAGAGLILISLVCFTPEEDEPKS
jgi:hypothetical protein